MTLKFINTVSKKEYTFTVTDLNDSRIYYHFKDFVLDDGMDDGSYDYMLFDDKSNLVAQGNLQIGDFVPETKTYTENKTYKQYNS